MNNKACLVLTDGPLDGSDVGLDWHGISIDCVEWKCDNSSSN